MRPILAFFAALVLAGLPTSTLAQTISIPDPGLNAAICDALGKPFGPLTEPDLLSLTNLNARNRNVSSIAGLETARNLVLLNLEINHLSNVSLLGALTNLTTLDLSVNPLANFSLPSGLTNLTSLTIKSAGLTNLTLPAGLTALTYLDVSLNPVNSITLPAGLGHLTTLRLSENTNLTSLILPVGMTNLVGLHLTENQLTNLVLPSDMYRLESLNLGGNQLTCFTLPAGLTNLIEFFITGNQLTNVTLPPDVTQLIGFGYLGNPLMTVVLPETLAATNLAGDVATLRSNGVSVFTYPLVAQLVRPLALIGAFKFGITGPPGVYNILGSTNLTVWSAVGVASSPFGSVNFVDVTAHLSPQKFYRAVLQSPPANMVFIASNTFMMGTPANELNRHAD